MRNGKFLIAGLVVYFLSSIVLISNSFAGGGRGGFPPHNPEPMSYALLLAGGVTLVALRRWKARRNSKDLENHYK